MKTDLLLIILGLFILYFTLKKRKQETLMINKLVDVENKEKKVEKKLVVDKGYILNEEKLLANNNNKIWLYVEPIRNEKQIQLHKKRPQIPVFLSKQITNIRSIYGDKLIVLTPDNVKEYVSTFPIEMNHRSEIPLKKRVDLLYAFILEKYGGLCLSPGTVVININDIVSQSNSKDLVLIGSSPLKINKANKYYPSNNLIGAQRNSEIIRLYKERLIENNFVKDSENILSELIIENDPKEYYFLNSDYDGSYTNRNYRRSLEHYFGQHPSEYLKETLVVSIPYYEIIDHPKYSWILDLNNEQFDKVRNEITRLVSL
jgi:hypothetical protein